MAKLRHNGINIEIIPFNFDCMGDDIIFGFVYMMTLKAKDYIIPHIYISYHTICDNII